MWAGWASEGAGIPDRGARDLPPAPPVGAVPRTLVTEELARGAGRPLVSVIAGPGWGKTTLAAQLAADTDAVAWCRIEPRDRDPEVLASSLARAQVDVATAADLVVLDDVHHLAGSPSAPLVADLVRGLAGRARLVLLGDRDPGVLDARHRAAGLVVDLDARQLGLGVEETAALVADELEPDPGLAAALVELTGGWPAPIRLLVEALRAVPAEARRDRLATLAGPAGPVAGYLLGVVVPSLPASEQALLTQLALLGDATAEVVAAGVGVPLEELTPHLVRLEAFGVARWGPTGVRTLPVVGEVLRSWDDPATEGHQHTVDDLARRLADADEHAAALGVLVAAGRHREAAALIEAHGDTLLRTGEVRALARAGETLPRATRTADVERILGHALAYLGDWSAALACLQAAGAEGEGPLDPALALPLGLTQHLRGDLDAALASYRRGLGDDDQPAAPMLRSWLATAHWLRGEVEDARREAARAHRLADARNDDHARAHASTASALVAASDGDRHANQAHYQQALVAARRAGDRLQEARIRTNLGSHHLEDGRFAEAKRETDLAIDRATELGYLPILGVAWCNRAEIGLKTGQLDQAIADATTARELFARLGSRNESYAEHLLGDARREQGELVLAALAYERAIRLASPSGDHQGLVPAYIGLAKTLAATDPDRAQEVAERALELDEGMARPDALLALAWVALAKGDAARARELAHEASEVAAPREDRVSLAEAATCLAVAGDDPVVGLRRALVLWREVDAPISTARVELGLARRSDRPDERAQAPVLEQRLLAWGVPPDGGSYPHRVVAAAPERPRLAVRVLGGFVVERGGQPIPRSAWGSRKARDLLKVLVVRGGHRVGREQLADLLWPDEPYDDVSNRLSVALSVLRSVLATDDTAAPILTVEDGIALDVEAVDVDLVRFEELADEGERASRSGDRAAAVAALGAAEEAYGGDLLEDDLDAPWLVDRREELRNRYIGVARSLAALVAEDDPDHALRLLLRVLDRDGYDEPAHLEVCRTLLRAGRHGEARRRHRLYEQRMAELDLPAVGFGSLATRPTTRSTPGTPRAART
jgi:DNA-binding SARP family transcriptional activator/ATP/maltotriose-dependent transcriptional regulator MalT